MEHRMKRKPKPLMYVDYETDTLEDIRLHEIERLRALLASLNRTKRLCSYDGSIVVAEFGFKGTLQDVRRQLFNLRERYMKQGITEEDREEMEINWERLSNHMRSQNEDGLKEECRKNVLTDLDKAWTYARAMHRREDEIHEKKECLCYSNGEADDV